MPLWWTLIVIAGILLNLARLRIELRKPKAQRNQAMITNSILMIIMGIGFLIWSQTMLVVITVMFSPFWVCFGAGAVVVLMGLAKQKFNSPAMKRMGKLNILVGLIIMGLTYWFFYLR